MNESAWVRGNLQQILVLQIILLHYPTCIHPLNCSTANVGNVHHPYLGWKAHQNLQYWDSGGDVLCIIVRRINLLSTTTTQLQH